jgi:hypothetical protein
MLEHMDGARERIHELQRLSNMAEDGDEDARRELRRALRESAPEVIARLADIARTYRRMLADTASGGDPLVKDAIAERARLLALELAGDDRTPLEVLLSERVASLWVLVELQDALMAAWYKSRGQGTSVALALQMARMSESASRRYLAAIKTLAQVQRLRGPPCVQVNIGENQLNVS